MDLNVLREIASTCDLCELHSGRFKPVFDKGNPNAKLFLCGMCPAHEENKKGLPFVGRAGQLLDDIIDLIGFTLEDVYITNMVKCFVAPGVSLKDSWVSSCLPYVISQISMLKPKAVITLGADSSNSLLGFPRDTKIGSIRHKIFNYSDNVKVVPTYHTSYLVRQGGKKSKAFDKVVSDFMLAKTLIS